ncbi:hypothetical protein C8Q79DRAFT_721158 [Trametes meyenii]|nr:hypothetical protein C8Q79DRAFT_721158 [Trametes meyenii]
MIVAEILAVCFLALMGVLQHGSMVDSLFPTLSRLGTPTLNSATSFLQVTGLNLHLALDAVPSAEVPVSSSLGRLRSIAILGVGSTNHTINLNIQDPPTVLDRDLSSFPLFVNITETFITTFDSAPSTSTVAPISHRYQVVSLMVRIGLLVLAFWICRAVRVELCLRYPSFDKPKTDAPSTANLSRLEHLWKLLHDKITPQVYRILGRTPPTKDLGVRVQQEASTDPLLHVFSASTLQDLCLLCAPSSAFVPPSVSTTPNFAEHSNHIFAHLRSLPSLERSVVDDVSYLQEALGIADDSAPSLRGWCSEELTTGTRPNQEELDLWMFPGADVDFVEQTVVLRES